MWKLYLQQKECIPFYLLESYLALWLPSIYGVSNPSRTSSLHCIGFVFGPERLLLAAWFQAYTAGLPFTLKIWEQCNENLKHKKKDYDTMYKKLILAWFLSYLHNYFDYHVCLSIRPVSVTKFFFRLNRLGITPWLLGSTPGFDPG